MSPGSAASAAGPGFRLVAAMNPFDAIGTARVSQAIADRLCRIAIRYQDEDAERRIVEQATGRSGEVAELMVALVRASREHPDLRIGASVRAAIDATLLADGLQRLRREQAPVARPRCWTRPSPRCPAASRSRTARRGAPRRSSPSCWTGC